MDGYLDYDLDQYEAEIEYITWLEGMESTEIDLYMEDYRVTFGERL